MKRLLTALGVASLGLLFASLPRAAPGISASQGSDSLASDSPASESIGRGSPGMGSASAPEAKTSTAAAAVVTPASLFTKRAPPATRVWFPPSSFRMGSSPEEVLEALTQCADEPLSPRCPDFGNEQPLRTVSLSRFGLDTTEVSVVAYARCVQARRCRPIPYYRGGRRFDRPDLPAVLVDHRNASTYCEFMGGQLPTEAQFERAARGLGRRKYAWGNHYHRHVANHGQLAHNPTFADDGHIELAPVTSYPAGATPEGVFNLAGNAAEWVSDSYAAYYDEHDVRDPKGPDVASGATDKVARGGGYASPAVLLRGAARQAHPPQSRSAEVGFRCAYAAP